MDDRDFEKQINQMCEFIMLEAREKSNEIHLKTEHDFNLEKQMMVHNSKLKLQQDFKRKEKDMETQKRM
jgi:V-type H+-transporting ATPase subunit E